MKKIILISFLTLSLAFAQAQKKTDIPNGARVQGRDFTGPMIDGYNQTKAKVDGAAPAGNSLVLNKDSLYRKPGSFVPMYDYRTKPTDRDILKAYKARGSAIKILPLTLSGFSSQYTMTDGEAIFALCYLRDTTTLSVSGIGRAHV